jgi:hypothetical protein
MSAGIDESIGRDGDLPGIMGFLPSTGLIKESTIYFRHYVWLNSYFYIADGNPFQIEEDCDALLSQYASGEDKFYLLLVKYPSENNARQGYSGYWKSQDVNPDEGLHIREVDGYFTAGQQHQNYVVFLFRFPETLQATTYINNVLSKINNK